MTWEELIENVSFLSLSSSVIEKFNVYLSLLIEWSKKMNLTSIKEEGDIIEKHFYDSLLPMKYMQDFAFQTALDVGSGAGFPGMVLAIIYPEVSWTLIDATEKKCKFLEAVKKALNLSNVRIIHGRIEDYLSILSSDFVIARAVASLPILLELTLPFVKTGGRMCAMKGSFGLDELKASERAIHVLGGNVLCSPVDYLPFDQGKRVNIWIEKVKNSPAGYPREYSKIKAKPL